MKHKLISVIIFSIFFVFCISNANAAILTESPHIEITGGVNTSFCLGSSNSSDYNVSGCHKLHEAAEPALQRTNDRDGEDKEYLLTKEDEKDVCYTCHDQTGGSNVKDEFGNDLGIKTSAHNIFISPEEGGLLCSSCHTSHMQAEDGQAPTGAYEVVVLLRVQIGTVWKYLIAAWNNLWEDTAGDMEKLAQPIDFCGGCHSSPTSAFGDHVSNFGDSAHNGSNFSNPPTLGFGGTVNSEIKCNVCHQPHGSDNPKLLSTNINGQTVSWNDNSVCYACHTYSGGAYKGREIFEKTKHFTKTTSILASVTVAESYEPGYCLNCHDPHGTQYTDFRREDKNQQCYVCHNAAEEILPSGYSFRSETRYTESAHGSTDSNTIWPSTAYTGGAIGVTTGATAGECINCHDPMGRAPDGSTTPYAYMLMKWSVDMDSEEQELCYECHSVGFNYDQQVDNFYGMTNSLNTNIFAAFTSGTVSATSTWGNEVNTRHDISYNDQQTSGASVECGSCHNSHINNKKYDYITKSRIADPDDLTQNFTEAYAKDAKFANGQSFSDNDATDLTSSFDRALPNFVNYCLKCHDGSAPNTVSGAFDVSASYTAASGADKHGRGDGAGANLKFPYYGGSPGDSGTTANAYSAMNCNDCHGSHGTTNLYNLKDPIFINDQYMAPSVSAEVTNSYYGGRDGWCTSCHASLPGGAAHDGTQACGDCHYHGSNF